MKRKPGLAETIAAAGVVLLLVWGMVLAAPKSPKRHSSGRALPAMPKITKPVLFNTPEVDRILQALRLNLQKIWKRCLENRTERVFYELTCLPT